MSAGDLVNNLGKLELKLKQINFRNFRRSELLSGILDIYISIYGYVFSSFNQELSKLVASHKLELYGKTNKRFVHNLYLIVRDILNYKPPITKDIFLSNYGFVEMKMIMCTQILQLVLAKCKELSSSDKTKKNYRKYGSFSSLSTPGDKGKNNIKNVSDCENANNVTTSVKSGCKKNEPHGSMLPSMQRNISSQVNEISENAYKSKTTTAKQNNFLSHHHLSSNYFKLFSDNGEIPRHVNDCTISKNPVSKCNVARSSYSKCKAVVLEKQEPPPQEVDIKVLKGPLQINDGFSGVLRIIPPEELSCDDVSFCQNSILNARNLVSKNLTENTTSINATIIIPGSDITTTAIIPKYTENDIHVTTPGSEGSLLTFLTSSTITKLPKVCPVMTATLPVCSSTTEQKYSLKSTAPTESSSTILKHSNENNQLKGIALSTSNNSYAVGTMKVADVQNPKSYHSERIQTVKVLSQIKNLSQNLTGCTETLQQIQQRSQQWNTQNMFLDSSEEIKENISTPNRETIPDKLKCVIKQDNVDLSKKKNENQTSQLDHWIAKMNLLECAVKSLESKFKSL